MIGIYVLRKIINKKLDKKPPFTLRWFFYFASGER
jgi:uncharacterized protein YneF (UPF0154 family)